MKNEQYEKLRSQFRKVFESKWDRSELVDFEDLREKFAFHMADIADNFLSLSNAYENIDSCDTKCLTDRAELFFNHCVPHLMAAAQIYDEIPEIFKEQNGVHDWNSFTDVDEEVA